jgi:hypothetical protein
MVRIRYYASQPTGRPNQLTLAGQSPDDCPASWLTGIFEPSVVTYEYTELCLTYANYELRCYSLHHTCCIFQNQR